MTAWQGVRLLVVDPDLAGALPPEEVAAARQEVVVPAIDLAPGPWSPERLSELQSVRDEVLGFLVVDGVLTIDLHLAGRTCSRPIGPGEIVLLDDSALAPAPVAVGWTVLANAELAILDARLLLIARRWPPLFTAIVRRAASQARRASLFHAMTQLTRVEERLMWLLLALADRFGVVRSDGVFVALPATHEVLARMIGARRSTVSLGLRALVETGRVRVQPGGWLLPHDALEEMSRLQDEDAALDLGVPVDEESAEEPDVDPEALPD